MPEPENTTDKQAGADSRDSFVGAVAELEALLDAGPSIKPWSEHDVSVLERYYLRVPTRAIAGQLGRTLSSVMNKAQALGFTRRDVE